MANIPDHFPKQPVLPDYKRFAVKDLPLDPWWDIKFTLPAGVVAGRQSGMQEFEREIVTYSFGQDQQGEYIDVRSQLRAYESAKRMRIYATGEYKHLPARPDVGVCEYCGDQLEAGHSLCGECGAGIISHGSIWSQELKALARGLTDLANLPENEKRWLRFVQWTTRFVLTAYIGAINAEVSAGELRLWVYTRGRFRGEIREEFTKGVTSELKSASYLLRTDDQALNEFYRGVKQELLQFGIEANEIPQQAEVVFTSAEPDLAQEPVGRIYTWKKT